MICAEITLKEFFNIFAGPVSSPICSSSTLRSYATVARSLQRSPRVLPLASIGSVILSNNEVAARTARRRDRRRELRRRKQSANWVLEGKGQAVGRWVPSFHGLVFYFSRPKFSSLLCK